DLFIGSVGLSVTAGLMGFVNLAHGAFAMLGGYVIVLSMRRWGLGLAPALALGFIVIAAVGVVFERLLYARLYRAPELDQVLFSIGLVFITIASVTLLIGPENQPLTLPEALQGQIDLGFVHYRTYSIFLIVVGASVLIGVLDFVLKKYLPQGGTLFIYALTILLLLWRPQGLFGGKSA